ncbi:hypothetical protein ACES2J_12490 [Bdellovibrio bacteriovorus]|uniref:restriction endonuclease subunit S n=1 Tax=Bdellovibrio bacteriovorus TaxID=959 RepID=UPI0035A5DC7D
MKAISVSLRELVQDTRQFTFDKTQEYEFVEMADVVPGERFVASKALRKPVGGSRFADGDILFARITPCLEHGKIAQFRASTPGGLATGSTEFFVFRARKPSDQNFLFYLLTTPLIRRPAEQSMVGASGRQRAQLDKILDVTVSVPDEQLREILGTKLSLLDERVFRNMERIRILEQTLHSVFGEEFSDLFKTNSRSPALASLITVSPRVARPTGNTFHLCAMEHVNQDSLIVDTTATTSKFSGSKFQNRDVLLARITPCFENGKAGIIFNLPPGAVAVGSTEFIVLRENGQFSAEFIYCLIKSKHFRTFAKGTMTGASGRQRLGGALFETFQVNVPDSKKLQSFNRFAALVVKQIYNLHEQCTLLTEVRDALVREAIESGNTSAIVKEQQS